MVSSFLSIIERVKGLGRNTKLEQIPLPYDPDIVAVKSWVNIDQP